MLSDNRERITNTLGGWLVVGGWQPIFSGLAADAWVRLTCAKNLSPTESVAESRSGVIGFKFRPPDVAPSRDERFLALDGQADT